jgi:uncharacterized membrane protein YcaP (DUF421 family)
VQIAVLESAGKLSVLLKPEYQPVTMKDMGSKPSGPDPQVPMELVVDGQILYENLRRLGKTGSG